jgi:hypothetical protein
MSIFEYVLNKLSNVKSHSKAQYEKKAYRGEQGEMELAVLEIFLDKLSPRIDTRGTDLF